MSSMEEKSNTDENLIKNFVVEESSGVDPEDLKEKKRRRKEKKITPFRKEKELPSYEKYIESLESLKDADKEST